MADDEIHGDADVAQAEVVESNVQGEDTSEDANANELVAAADLLGLNPAITSKHISTPSHRPGLYGVKYLSSQHP